MFRPEPSVISASQLTAFAAFCEASTGRRFADHAALHDFSVAEYRRFWLLFLRWSGLLHEGSADPVCTDDVCESAAFFPGLRLNYAENLLRIDSPEDADRTALVAHHAQGPPERMTRRDLRDRVRSVAAGLRDLGMTANDRVVAVAGNNAEVVVGGLAATAIGATFSSAAPDMGAPALLSRFEQLTPTILMANLEGSGGGAATALADRVAEVARALPSLTAVVALDDGPAPPRLTAPLHRLLDLSNRPAVDEADGEWPRFPFNHPLFVLFSSGTTGRPKCIVHGAGGTLLEHVKEHRLHVDLRPGETLFFQTSAAWMMWNWQLSALASGSEIVLYDGPLTGPSTLWQVVSAERVSVFGTGPTYLQLCEDSGFSPRREDMPDLRAILSTGSVLHDWQYDWVRDKVGPVPLQSISGGTDIIGCFVLGNPNLPVHRGRIQCRSLGLDVQALPAAGGPSSSPVGELVCRNPFPSRPLGLLGDDGRRFHDAYFKRNPGVWTHGDLVEFDHDGQARIHGRSDGVLKVQGVRVGPAEIYGALRDVLEVGEAMVVEQQAPELHGRSRLVLLAVVNEPATLDGRLKVRIRREIARQASPLHVPELLVQVEELPTTHSGKRSERAARDAVNGLPAGNAEALRNPDSLDRIRLSVKRAAEELSELAGAAEPARGASTEARLRAVWESVLGVAPLRPDDNFFDVGGNSLAAVRLFQLIHDRMGIDLPLSTVIHAQTPASMAALIDGPPEQRVPSLVLLRPGTGDRPLFLMHSINGDVLEMRPLALQLSADRPVYGLQARGLDPHERPQTRVEEMAETYIAILRSVQPTGPYALGGYSFGGLVAFETARRLTALGEEVDWLGLIDTEVHHDCLPALLRWRFLFARSLGFLRAALGAPRDPPVPLPEWEALPPLERHLGTVGWKAFGAYRPGPYAGSAALFLSELRRPEMCDPIPVWTRCVKGSLAIQRVPGGHFDVIKEPNLGVLSEQVSASLARGLEPGVASSPSTRR